jgi:hypothetical protein
LQTGEETRRRLWDSRSSGEMGHGSTIGREIRSASGMSVACLAEQHRAAERDDRHVVAVAHEARVPEWDRVRRRGETTLSPGMRVRSMVPRHRRQRGVGDVVPCLPARSPSHTVVELHSVAISHLSGRDGQQYAVRWGDRQRRCNLSATPPGLPLPHPQKEETMATVEATRLQQVVYELLDAHDDTARLVAETADDARWSAHLEYLRALQRRTRGILARSGEAGRS